MHTQQHLSLSFSNHLQRFNPLFFPYLSTKMGKKKTHLFPFKSSLETPSTSWSWPSACTTPKTLSFRAPPQDIFKTMNSTFLNSTQFSNDITAPESIFLEEEEEEDLTEEVIRGLKSEERLVFKADETSSLILEGNKKKVLQEKDVLNDNEENSSSNATLALATSVESTNPFGDFKKSMEEMVEAHDIKDWDVLEELLSCYLKVNCKSNHGYIIGAFVELLVSLGFVASSSNNYFSRSSNYNYNDLLHHCNSFNSPLSYHPSSSNSSNSPCLSSSLEEVDHDDVDKPGNNVVVITSSS